MSNSHVKDASFLQQHIEKLILAAGLLILAAAVFLFVIGNPFAVEVNRQSYDSPDEAVGVLVRNGDRLSNGLIEPKPLPEIVVPDFGGDFLSTMNRDADLDRLVDGFGDPGLTRPAVYPDIPDPSRYALVYPPAPKNITSKFGTDVLDAEFDPKAAEEFYTLWGKDPEEPGDFSMFMAAGEFDVWEWVQRLKADPTGEEEIKIPGGIWAQRFGIAGVALLREEWDPEKGQWVNRTIVQPLPGQMRILPDEKAESETIQAIALLTELRAAQVELAQPELPWLADLGEGFVQATPPGEEGDGDADGLLQILDEKNLGKAEKEIIKLQKQIEELRERKAKRDERQGGNARPGDGARPGDFNQGGSASQPKRDRLAEQIAALQERIRELQPKAQKEEENRRRLAEAKAQREAELARREALRDERDRALGNFGDDPLGLADIPGMQLKEGSTLRVWAADPTMQPGKTYHYKLLVAVINPLYAVPRLASDQLEANQHRAALLPTQAEIDAMDWIGPVKVEPKSQFFFTNGGEARADIDIYRRYKGELRVQEFKGAPGDVIGGMLKIEDEFGDTEEIDMGVGAVLVDVEKRRDLLNNRTEYALIFMDAQGNIHERIHELDQSSPVRKELQDELKEGPKNALRPDPEAQPENNFGPGGFDPRFGNF